LHFDDLPPIHGSTVYTSSIDIRKHASMLQSWRGGRVQTQFNALPLHKRGPALPDVFIEKDQHTPAHPRSLSLRESHGREIPAYHGRLFSCYWHFQLIVARPGPPGTALVPLLAEVVLACRLSFESRPARMTTKDTRPTLAVQDGNASLAAKAMCEGTCIVDFIIQSKCLLHTNYKL